MAQTLEKVSIIPQPDTLPAAMTAVTPMAMLAQAIERGMSPETIDKMMGLAERWEANQARKAFNEAFAGFKAEAVSIVRNRHVADGPLKGKSYAELVSFVDAATPALSKHGLSASWDITRDERDWIEVTCMIEHTLGGCKKVAFGGPPDVGGAKNVLQARVSTVTYLERVTFKAATGLAEQGDDKDGNVPKGGGVTIALEHADKLIERMESVGADRKKFLTFFGIDAVSDLPVNRVKEANEMLDKFAQQKAARA